MVYLVSVTHSATDVSFVAAKTRVSPLQPQTIPRLELLSALLLTRLMTTVMDSLQLQEVNVKCFTDSQVALYWIQGTEKNWKPFVQNRVTEIRRKLRPDYWYHCPGKTNPADLPSRGISLLELSTSQLWQHGPDWLPEVVLSQGEQVVAIQSMPDEYIPELNSKATYSHTLLSTTPQPQISQVLDCRNFSSLSRLIRTTAQVLRAVKRFKGEVFF